MILWGVGVELRHLNRKIPLKKIMLKGIDDVYSLVQQKKNSVRFLALLFLNFWTSQCTSNRAFHLILDKHLYKLYVQRTGSGCI